MGIKKNDIDQMQGLLDKIERDQKTVSLCLSIHEDGMTEAHQEEGEKLAQFYLEEDFGEYFARELQGLWKKGKADRTLRTEALKIAMSLGTSIQLNISRSRLNLGILSRAIEECEMKFMNVCQPMPSGAYKTLKGSAAALVGEHRERAIKQLDTGISLGGWVKSMSGEEE